MTIDEAIAHARKVAKRNRILLDSDELVQKSYDAYFDKLKCEKCAEEHEQLVEWLQELKAYHQHEVICNKAYNAGYNKALDYFVEKVKLKYLGVHPDELYEKYYPIEICKQIKEIAEQLKAGGENERK